MLPAARPYKQILAFQVQGHWSQDAVATLLKPNHRKTSLQVTQDVPPLFWQALFWTPAALGGFEQGTKVVQ